MFFSDALVEIWNLVRRTNKYIDETQPWILCKDEAKKAELANALYNVAESIRIVSILIQPFMPNTPAKSGHSTTSQKATQLLGTAQKHGAYCLLN